MSCPYTGWESPRTARNGSRPSVRTARYRSARPGSAHGPSSCIQSNGRRSEEHTSELQSLMRISYAVFCLKKKKKTKNSIYMCECKYENHDQVLSSVNNVQIFD